MLTKTDYLLYLDAPLHLWADKHGRLDQETLSRYQMHLMQQGRNIEQLARQYLQHALQTSYSEYDLSFEVQVSDGVFHARLDALVYDPAQQTHDIYEIKSSSSIKKEHLIDVAFQRLVTEANLPLRNSYILHINKDYARRGELDIGQLFKVVNVDSETDQLRQELLAARAAAWQVASQDSPDGIEECLKPDSCPCPSLCHPGLPEHSIFNLPRLHHTKARQLKSQGVLAIQDIPGDFPLSEMQQAHVHVVKSGQPRIDKNAIRQALDELVYPLYFLDYETYNPAVPEYDGYHPYQHIVFQYSLHVFPEPNTGPVHHEFLADGQQDPTRPLLQHLLERIGSHGSVIVWNKSFEGGRNKELAERHPEYASQLNSINARMFDLMDIFKQGKYIHPDFHGSASIKNILPVLVKDLSYDSLPIPKGDEAMLAWVSLMRGQLSPEDIAQTRQDLLRYCAMDTMAMVKNWQVLQQTVAS